MLLRDFLSYWLTSVVRGNLRANSYTVYRGYVYNHINNFIGGIALAELKPDILQEFIAQLQSTEHGCLCAKVVKSIFSMLKTAMKCAVEYEYITKNPCQRIRLPRHQDKDVQVFTHDEQKRLETIIIKMNDIRHFAVLVCLYTGLRIGEVCALRWENIDLENCFISIKFSMNRINNSNESTGEQKTQLKIEEPKTTKSKRLLPIPEFLCKYFERIKENSDGNGFVFTLKKTGNPIQPRTLQYIYRRLLKISGIEYRNFHTLRHTFATRAIEMGTDIKTVSDVLGHTNTSITINRYTHSLMEQKQNMMTKFNSTFKAKDIK